VSLADEPLSVRSIPAAATDLDARSGDRWLVGVLAVAAAVVGSSYHFVMEDKFAAYLAGCVIVLALTEIDGRSLRRTLSLGAIQLFAAFVAYYAWRFDGSIAGQLWVSSPERIPREALVITLYLVVLVLVASSRRDANVRTFVLVFTIVGLLLEFYGLVSKSRIIANPNVYAYQIICACPVVHLILVRRPWILTGTLLATAYFTMFGLGSRTGFVALLLYLGVYWTWPLVSRSRRRIALTLLAVMAGIVAFMYIYLFQTDTVTSNAAIQRSEEISDKGSLGRLSVWIYVVSEISKDPWWGKCGNCNTEYFYEPDIGRNLSSHNEYLEVTYRLGLVGLAVLLATLVAFGFHFQRHRDSQYARLGFAFLVAALWTASTYEYIVFTFLTAGMLFWIAMALVLAHVAHDAPGRAESLAGS